MKTHYLLTFIIAFVVPIAYQRIRFALREKDFLTTPLRTKSGLNLHHGHWGLLWIFVSFILLFNGKLSSATAILSGFGWGLLSDEIIPSLKMPGNDRPLELLVYGEARNATIFLSTVVLIIVIIVSIVCI